MSYIESGDGLAILVMVVKDERYQNAMKNSDRQNTRMESERALQQFFLDNGR